MFWFKYIQTNNIPIYLDTIKILFKIGYCKNETQKRKQQQHWIKCVNVCVHIHMRNIQCQNVYTFSSSNWKSE